MLPGLPVEGHLIGSSQPAVPDQIFQFWVADWAVAFLAVEAIVLPPPGRKRPEVALADERAPEVWMRVLGPHHQLGISERFGARLARQDMPVEVLISSRVSSSGTFHKLITRVFAPARAKGRRKPKTPSPLRISPRPVLQAERTTNSVSIKSMPVTCSAVKRPFSASGGNWPFWSQGLPPAKPIPIAVTLRNPSLEPAVPTAVAGRVYQT